MENPAESAAGALPAPEAHAAPAVVPRWLVFAFFLSGFGALIYQIAWQRSLFTLFGIHVESVSVVVTVFMLGLGLGSRVGGLLSRRPGIRHLSVFARIEFGIGAFGMVSPILFDAVGARTVMFPPAATALVTFLLLLLPTLGMGATLPLLVAHAVRQTGNVGQSVGLLYFVNTLGSAAAAIATATVLLARLGLQGSVALAACTNFAVGALVLARAPREAE